MCPRFWLWTCDVCPHYAGEGLIHLDDTILGSDGKITIGDTVADKGNLEDAVILAQLPEALTDELDKLQTRPRR